MKTTLPILEYASLTDRGRVRLANEDASFCDERMGLFVVCDGLGGRPSGEAASHIIAQSLRHLIRRKLRGLTTLNGNVVKLLLQQVAIELNEELLEVSQGIESLVGMGATIAALLIDGTTAYVLHVGDSRVYLLRNGQMQQVTQDHFRMGIPAPSAYRNASNTSDATDVSNQNTGGSDDSTAAINSQALEKAERRLLTQFIGIARPLDPEVSVFALKPNDRFLLCSDGLTDPVPDTVVARTLVQQDPLTAICQSLINAANVAGGPDNITTIIVNYRGTKQVEMDTLRSYGKVRAADPPKGIAAALHDRLLALQSDIHWLIKGTSEISSTPEPERLSTVKRILDEDTYAATATEHTNTNSLHLFHAAATDKQSQWRLKYETHHFELSKHLTTITASGVRFSPIMTSDETAHILTTLWRDWRRVEKRYFQLCQESNFDQKQDMLNFLLDHMRNSVNTLIGLMRFLPMFMRNVD